MRGILVVFGLASAVCDFGPLTPVEVRAFGSLAYQAFSTPRERSPAVLREQAIREELHFELGQIGASSPPVRASGFSCSSQMLVAYFYSIVYLKELQRRGSFHLLLKLRNSTRHFVAVMACLLS